VPTARELGYGVVSSWAHAARRPGDRAIAMGFAVLTLAVVGAIMAWSRPGAPGVMLLTLVLPLTLFAALRVGPLGATTSAGAACLLMAHLATRGIGPFTAIAFEHRHVGTVTRIWCSHPVAGLSSFRGTQCIRS